MSIAPSIWRSGRAKAQSELEDIPEEAKCPECGGQGEAMARHRFTGGWSYQPCNTCWGSGRIDDEPKIMKPTWKRTSGLWQDDPDEEKTGDNTTYSES